MKRADIAPEYTWNLEDIFKTPAEWEAAFQSIKESLPRLRAFSGTLVDEVRILEALTCYAGALEQMELVYVYARLNQDLDTANNAMQALCDKARLLYVELGEATSFFSPELLTLAPERLEKMAAAPEFEHYRMLLKGILRQKPHTLDAAGERLLALSGDMASGAENVYGLLHNADLSFPEIDTEKGRVPLTYGSYSVFMESEDRKTRKNAYEAMYDTHLALKNTFAGLLGAQVKKDVFYAQARNYSSARAASMDGEDVPERVYDALIEAIRRHLPSMQRYLGLRAKVLELDVLAPYDLYVPLCEDPGFAANYEEAKALVLAAVAPLGDEYVRVLERSYQERWIDVEETPGKCTGAYAMNCYAVHPYVLLNHQGTLDSVFTLAHEMGHALNGYLSAKAQPYLMSENCIFLAEVASTANEILLLKHLLKDAKGKAKAYLLNHFLESFRTTVFRQTMFAEFEHLIHAEAEKGESLTCEKLSEIYLGLNKAYYAPAVECDARIAAEWMRIPHFYYNFYVYKYATSFCAAVALTGQIEKEGAPAVERYLEFLSAGSSDDPVKLLARAGVDATDPASVENALLVFDGLVDELEAALKEANA